MRGKVGILLARAPSPHRRRRARQKGAQGKVRAEQENPVFPRIISKFERPLKGSTLATLDFKSSGHPFPGPLPVFRVFFGTENRPRTRLTWLQILLSHVVCPGILRHAMDSSLPEGP